MPKLTSSAALASAAALLALLGSAAQAQVIVYNNTTSLKSSFSNSGATATNLVTDLVADDINPTAHNEGKGVTQFTFSVVNNATVAVTAAVHVSFYDDLAPDLSSGPGNFLAGVNFTPTSFAPGTVSLFTYTAPVGTPVFTIPFDNSLWAGLTFDALGSATTTAANLNLLGQGLYNPPTVGGSDNRFFISNSPGLYNGSSNPAGPSTYTFGATGPVANFGWQFQVAAAPEPSAWASLGVGVLGLGALVVRRRRSCAA